jgi:hypothetical protein
MCWNDSKHYILEDMSKTTCRHLSDIKLMWVQGAKPTSDKNQPQTKSTEQTITTTQVPIAPTVTNAVFDDAAGTAASKAAAAMATAKTTNTSSSKQIVTTPDVLDLDSTRTETDDNDNDSDAGIDDPYVYFLEDQLSMEKRVVTGLKKLYKQGSFDTEYTLRVSSSGESISVAAFHFPEPTNLSNDKHNRFIETGDRSNIPKLKRYTQIAITTPNMKVILLLLIIPTMLK